MLKNFREKVMNTKSDENRIVIPFLEGLSFPASEISMHLKDFVFLAGGLSFLTTFIILCLVPLAGFFVRARLLIF